MARIARWTAGLLAAGVACGSGDTEAAAPAEAGAAEAQTAEARPAEAAVQEPGGAPATAEGGDENTPPAGASEGTVVWDFEDVSPGGLPAGWVVQATGTGRPLATWQVVDAGDARPGPHVLALTSPNHDSAGTFNLCWTKAVRFLDGTISVKFHADAGRIDQGGGILWRARGAQDYYVARFNPLEDNFRFYTVQGGVRRMKASADVHLDDGWHEMRVAMHGDHFEGWLDGRKLLDARDATFPEAGGVGLWTKADAATRFDDFRVTPAESGR